MSLIRTMAGSTVERIVEVAQSDAREELETQITAITSDVNYVGGVQYWIKKHDSLLLKCTDAFAAGERKGELAGVIKGLQEAVEVCEGVGSSGGSMIAMELNRRIRVMQERSFNEFITRMHAGDDRLEREEKSK